MSKQQDMDIAWRRCIEKDKEVQEELPPQETVVVPTLATPLPPVVL